MKVRTKIKGNHSNDPSLEQGSEKELWHNSFTSIGCRRIVKRKNSYLHERKRDGSEIFSLKEERHVRYWMDQAFPVLLVIRNSEGETRWMEIRDWLKKATNNGKNEVKQILFESERFDVMSIRNWRKKILGNVVG